VTARGLIGSEKEAFFQDERVRDVLARHGVTVTVQRPARAALPSSYDPKQYDFGFPSGRRLRPSSRRRPGPARSTRRSTRPSCSPAGGPLPRS
jgi:hypothetical protein